MSFFAYVPEHVQGVELVWAVILEQLKWCNYPIIKKNKKVSKREGTFPKPRAKCTFCFIRVSVLNITPLQVGSSAALHLCVSLRKKELQQSSLNGREQSYCTYRKADA